MLDPSRKLHYVLLWRSMPILALLMTTAMTDDAELNKLYRSLTLGPNSNNILWPTTTLFNEMRDNGTYDPRSMIPTRFQMYEDNVFIAYPRFRPGVPFSLGNVSAIADVRCNPKLTPFPNWDLHAEWTCERITNAIDIFLDCNKILWVLDIGIVNTLDNPELLELPKVVGINVETAKVDYSIDLSFMMVAKSRLQFVVADVVDTKTFLFISDAGTNSILQYSVDISKGNRVMLPDQISEGSKKDVFYLLVARRNNLDSALFFTYLSNKNMFSIPTNKFRMGKMKGSIKLEGQKDRKMVLLGTDNGQNIFFRFQGDNSLYMWNTIDRFRTRNFIMAQRSEYCRIPTCVAPGYMNIVWMLETNFQDFVSGNVGCLGTNNRIHPVIKTCPEEDDEV